MNFNPKVGWWEDADPLVVYHGTHKRHIDSVYTNGLDRKDPDTGMISVALEPFTAKAYAAMSGAGGEANFRTSGAAVSTPTSERVVFTLEIPQKWIQEHVDPNLGGNIGDSYKRMRNREEYEKSSITDQQYYQFAELRLDAAIPARFIKGHTTFK
ncbi:hypothetical protein VPHK356_0041 [Vibrio phage K356]|nr:hypothetical protein MYOV002v2_p0037 [Vibrio phage 144E46.1]